MTGQAPHGMGIVELLDGWVGQAAVVKALGNVRGLAALAQPGRPRHPLDDAAVLRQRHDYKPASAWGD